MISVWLQVPSSLLCANDLYFQTALGLRCSTAHGDAGEKVMPNEANEALCEPFRSSPVERAVNGALMESATHARWEAHL